MSHGLRFLAEAFEQILERVAWTDFEASSRITAKQILENWKLLNFQTLAQHIFIANDDLLREQRATQSERQWKSKNKQLFSISISCPREPFAPFQTSSSSSSSNGIPSTVGQRRCGRRKNKSQHSDAAPVSPSLRAPRRIYNFMRLFTCSPLLLLIPLEGACMCMNNKWPSLSVLPIAGITSSHGFVLFNLNRDYMVKNNHYTLFIINSRWNVCRTSASM